MCMQYAAPPSKPTRPVILLTTTNSFKISFTVEFGSQPITRFLVNITQSNSRTESQKQFSLDETKYIESLIEMLNSEGVTTGYDVEIVVTGLKERVAYEFEVAAESSIGVGEFSDSSESTKLGKLYILNTGATFNIIFFTIMLMISNNSAVDPCQQRMVSILI